MANLLLTTDCQRSCSYCFAKEDRTKHLSFTWNNFLKALSFISTGPRALNLLGGEPTLHPDFMRMLEHLITNDYMVQIFTNGMVSHKLISQLKELFKRITLRKDQLYFAVNMNERKYRSEKEIYLQERFLDSMGKLAYLSFTIDDEDADLTFLPQAVNEFYLDNSIRLGLAMPVVGGDNKYLKPASYRKVAKKIVDLSRNNDDIIITFDCGFSLCMFSMEEIAELTKDPKNDFSFICGTPLDIYPDLTMTNCYPLSKMHRIPMGKFKTIMDAYNYFEHGFTAPIGIYEECSSCPFFKQACLGGCKGFLKFPGGE
jgi:sulfatase maturation enzyme AslB (radical SAM superfamily)